MKLFFAVVAFSIPMLALAERADKFEKTTISYDGDMLHDTVKGVSHFNENVVLTKGSLLVSSDTMTVTETPDGYHIYTVTSLKGNVAKFRQKQDSSNDRWINGQGETMVYTEKDDVLTITGNALVQISEQGVVAEEAASARIIYDARTEQVSTKGLNNATKIRSTLIISAKKDPLAEQ